jgi:hypothetical protein
MQIRLTNFTVKFSCVGTDNVMRSEEYSIDGEATATRRGVNPHKPPLRPKVEGKLKKKKIKSTP